MVQSVELIVRQLLDLNGFSTDDEGYNLTAQDILEEYDECGGDPMALIDHFADDIRWNNGIELKDWKDVRIVISILCGILFHNCYTHTCYPSSIQTNRCLMY